MTLSDELDVERLTEALLRVATGHRPGMTDLSWAKEHQQEFAEWCSQPSIAAEYHRLGGSGSIWPGDRP